MGATFLGIILLLSISVCNYGGWEILQSFVQSSGWHSGMLGSQRPNCTDSNGSPKIWESEISKLGKDDHGNSSSHGE